MLDLQQGLARNHLHSFDSIYHSKENCVGTRTTDLDIWDDEKCDNFGKHENEIRFQTWTDIEDDYGAYSPQLWRTSSFRYEAEASSLLPRNHRYSYPSPPATRLQAIVDGRKEIMDMIKDMPESCYELSLKDIVDHQHISEGGVEHDLVINEKSLNTKNGIEIKKVKKNITRAESMDSGVFLLKMFTPSSLGLNKKSTRGNSSKVSPKSTFEGSEKTGRKGWWKIKFLLDIGENRNRNVVKSRLTGSTSSSNSSSSSRNEESNFTPCCWSLNAKNCKPRRQRGCFL